jgi:hypothetical protein
VLAQIFWDGGLNGTGTNLEDPENWVGDKLPGPADWARINTPGPDIM